MFNKIAIVSIPVKDQQAAKAFYADVLGCKIVEDVPFGAGTAVRWIKLALPGTDTCVVLATWFPRMQPGSIQGLVLATDNIEKAHATLKARGLDISKVQSRPYGREATFTDPDGNGWVLQQPSRTA